LLSDEDICCFSIFGNFLLSGLFVSPLWFFQFGSVHFSFFPVTFKPLVCVMDRFPPAFSGGRHFSLLSSWVVPHFHFVPVALDLVPPPLLFAIVNRFSFFFTIFFFIFIPLFRRSRYSMGKAVRLSSLSAQECRSSSLFFNGFFPFSLTKGGVPLFIVSANFFPVAFFFVLHFFAFSSAE